MTSAGLPDRPDKITAEWLTQALTTSHPDVEVSRVEILDKHSGTTGRTKLGVSYASGERGPATVFVKLPPFIAQQRELVATTDMGRKEARFYAGPAAEVRMRIPRAYFAAFGDEPTEYIMVLEDLDASGCIFASRHQPHAEEFGEQLIESLANLHVQFWNDPRFNDELSWLRPPFASAMGAQLVDSARQQFEADFPPVFGELARLFVEHHERIRELWLDGEHTIVHGDTHAGNQFIDGDKIGLYDWAVVSKYPGMRDIANYMGNSCPTDLRRREGDRWLRKYHQVLVDGGVDTPTFDVLYDRYRIGVLYSLVSSSTTAAMGDRWQPTDVSMRGMTSAIDTCADLDTIGAIREAL